MASCRILDGVWYTSCKRVPLRFLVKTAALNFSFSSISLNVSGITMTKGVYREVYALAITHQECMHAAIITKLLQVLLSIQTYKPTNHLLSI